MEVKWYTDFQAVYVAIWELFEDCTRCKIVEIHVTVLPMDNTILHVQCHVMCMCSARQFIVYIASLEQCSYVDVVYTRHPPIMIQEVYNHSYQHYPYYQDKDDSYSEFLLTVDQTCKEERIRMRWHDCRAKNEQNHASILLTGLDHCYRRELSVRLRVKSRIHW